MPPLDGLQSLTAAVGRVNVVALPFEHGHDLAVVVNTPESEAVGVNSPGFVTTLSMFGQHLVTRPVTFTVPLSPPVTSASPSRMRPMEEFGFLPANQAMT